MPAAPMPATEAARLDALRRLGILDTPPEERFDRLTRLAQALFQVPIVLISLVDANRQWFKSCIGLNVSETSRDVSFCAHAILQPEAPLIILDARQDARFAANGLVTGEPFIRFYAGQPLYGPDRQPIGTLCIIDTAPHAAFGADQQRALADLARVVEQELASVTMEETLVALQQTQAALRDSEARFRAMAESIDAVFWMTDPAKQTMIYVSPAYERIWGRSTASLYADPLSFAAAIHPDDRERVVAAFPRQATGDYDQEYRVVRPDGTAHWIHDRAYPIRDEGGALVQVAGVAVDITNQKRSEDAQRGLQEEIIRVQAAAIAELSTPLISLTHDTVLMPLIGSVDSQRAQQIIDTLLVGVNSQRARVAILDLTGVPVVDTQVASALIRAAQAGRLLGAEVILTGIRPELAQTLVTLGVDLSSVITQSELQQGITYALSRSSLGLRRMN